MNYTRFGEYSAKKAGHEEFYYAERYTTMDYRGDLRVSPLSYWGFGVSVFTSSHDIMGGVFTAPMINKRVYVDDYAWIASMAILYNCHIQHHAIVSIGAVVNNMIVEPYHVVSGNPAVVIAIWNGKRWIKPEPIENHD